MAKPAPKRSKTASSARKAPKPTPRHTLAPTLDVEAFGLILLAVALLLGAALYAPPHITGLIGTMREPLTASLGWAAYLLPLPPLALGLLLFLRRPVRLALRPAVGGAILVYAALVGTGIVAPPLAGSAAEAAARPLRELFGPLALIVVLVAFTLGADIAAGLQPTVILRHALRLIARAAARVARAFTNVFGAARDTAERARAVAAVRAALEAHRADLDALETLFPGSAELGAWAREADDATRAAARMDEAELERLREDVAEWTKLVAAFTAERARDLAALLDSEDAGAGPVIEDARRALHAAVPGAGAAAKSLESLRRALLLDATALADAHRRERRERDAAAKALAAPIRAGALGDEIDRHHHREELSRDLRARADALVARANGYPGWPEFVARLERPAHPDVAAFAADVATTLHAGGADALPELPQWTRDLDALERRIARDAAPIMPAATLEPPAPAAASSTIVPPAALPLVADDADDFHWRPASSAARSNATLNPAWTPPAATAHAGLDAGDADDAAVYEAIFEMEYPGGNAVSGEAASVAASGLEIVDVDANEDADAVAPWVSPSERAAAKMAAAKAASAARPIMPRPADSHVGERIHASAVPAQGGIPIQVPGVNFLDPPAASVTQDLTQLDRDARARARVIDETLSHFGLQAKVVDYARGPTVTRYEVEPAPGEKISRIAGLANDLARALAVGGVRVEAPVPGKSVIGLEVPNADREPVTFRAGVESAAYARGKTRLPILLGKSIDGEMIVGDLGRMPHLLIAGSTGSGKSVCVNTLIMSLLYRYLPTELRFIMIDPKMVELTPYDGIPHLVRPVVTNPNDAAGVLLGCVAHMERRYKMMSAVGAKNLEQYNAKAREAGEPEMPFIVIVIDELADLMITSPKEVESAIMRLAQMARATGMHLVLATQRPSVDILTSLIKVNVPARVAFAVSSGHDSRTILDTAGAERLTGLGDMLFYQPGLAKPARLQGPYISENELARITEFLRRQYYDDDFGEAYGTDFDGVLESAPSTSAENIDFSDPLIRKAAEIVLEEGYASVSRLQRRLSVGHARAGKLVDALEAMKIVGPHVGSKAREVLITKDQLPEYFGA